MPQNRDLTKLSQIVNCGLCGRGLLLGERAEVFVNGSERSNICELCSARAMQLGWVREDQATEQPVSRVRGYRGRSLWDRISGRAEVPEIKSLDEEDGRPTHGGAMPQRSAKATTGIEQSQPPLAQVASSNVYGVPSAPEHRFAQALGHFNLSEYLSTVAGVARTLGSPTVMVTDSRTENSVVIVIVAWEISWYRYEIDLGQQRPDVVQVAKGYELDELTEFKLKANALLDGNGLLVFDEASQNTGVS